MLKIWEQLIIQNAELFYDCGPFCMNGGCAEGRMTCGKSIPAELSPAEIIRIDFSKLSQNIILEEGDEDENTAH